MMTKEQDKRVFALLANFGLALKAEIETIKITDPQLLESFLMIIDGCKGFSKRMSELTGENI